MTIYCFIVIALLTVAGCEKIENSTEKDLYLIAKVENAIEYSSVVAVKLMIRDKNGNDVELARGDWKDNGFAISLPKINRYNYGELIHMPLLPTVIYDNLVTITTNNRNARNRIAEFWGVDKEGNMIAEFLPRKIDEDGNMVRVRFRYVDSDVIISGYIEAETIVLDYFDEETGFMSNWIWENKTIFLIDYKEGWNASSHPSFQSSSGETIRKHLTIPTSSNLKWYARDDL
ncbi:hypothetical protein CDL62_03260 [Alkalitalea saponilacus]|nr:hypothetical protein CDL62_03260 [Alkalitalea saponilacus]